MERQVPRHWRRRIPGSDNLQLTRQWHQSRLLASTNSDLGHRGFGMQPAVLRFKTATWAIPWRLRSAIRRHRRPACSGIPNGSRISAVRAIHLMTVRGKEIAKAFPTGQKAQRAYFAGCSTGGQNALMSAQALPPDDYDGILAGAAAFNRTHLHMAGLAAWQITHASAGGSSSLAR